MNQFTNFQRELVKSIHVTESHPQYKIYLDYGINRFYYGKILIKHLLLFFKREEMLVLDVGSGVGGISAAFADELIEIMSLEFNRSNRDLIESIFADINRKPNLLIGDGHSIPFKNDKFNVILAVDLLEHLKEIKVFLSEVKRIIKGNGIVCLTIATKFNWNNIKRDPHYGLFGIILLPRFLREFIVVKLTKRNPTLDDYLWIRSYGKAFQMFKERGILLQQFSDFVLGLNVTGSLIDMADSRDVFYLELNNKNPEIGWFDKEKHEEGTQRWTKRIARGHILVPDSASKFQICYSCCNPKIEISPVRCIIKLGKRRIGELVISTPQWQEVMFNIPSKLARGKIERFEIKLDKTWMPHDVTGSSDSRSLGLAVRWIRC